MILITIMIFSGDYDYDFLSLFPSECTWDSTYLMTGWVGAVWWLASLSPYDTYEQGDQIFFRIIMG